MPRTHPNCYLALISEARAAGLIKINVISAWRPSLGSIVHRAGLGLDINYIESASEKIEVERKTLTDGKNQARANITQQEKDSFNALNDAKEIERRRMKDYDSAAKDFKEHPEDAAIAERRRAALDELNIARAATSKANFAWKEKLATNIPGAINSLRSKLSLRDDVHQILDPWYMDFNTNDKVPGAPNMQSTKVEQTHNNHLHITIKEVRLL